MSDVKSRFKKYTLMYIAGLTDLDWQPSAKICFRLLGAAADLEKNEIDEWVR